jgi:site-specific DNA-methyltransferase (adenine-specific)
LVERKQKPTPEFSPRNNIWRYNNGKGFTTRDDYAYQHPAMFPEALARDHIKSWSNEGDIVIDPFTGAGTTPAIAREEDRKFIGYEIDKKYYEIAQRRIEDRAARLVFEE